MFKNYLKLAIRNLWKNKAFSAINIIGLSLGLVVCITILLFVQYERNFDGMHKKNIYRLDEVQSWEGMVQPQKVALSMYPMGPSLKNDFPEVKNYVRIFDFEKAGLEYKNKHVYLEKVFWTDSSFFNVFDYKLVKGNSRQVLTQPNSVVLTEESAEKLFGQEDPMGKSVSTYNMRDTIHFTVTGIMENVPENSHLQFNGLYSLSSIVNPNDTTDGGNRWGGNWLVTYLELADNSNTKNMETRFPKFLQKYMGPEIIKGYQLFLQPLNKVHNGSSDITHDYHNFRKFDESYTNIFFIIAFIVLIIACVNFINLSTARAARRSKEVGVRKSIGAHRFQLVFQFLGESILLAFIAMVIAIVLVFLFLPFVNNLSEHQLSLSFIRQPVLLLQLILGTTVVGIISGIYPAFYLSSFKPVKVLKGIISTGKNKSFGRNVLVIGQFASATFLIISTVFVVKQLSFMRNKDAGFNKEQIVMTTGAYKRYAELKIALEANTLVKGVTGSSQRMGNNFHQTGFNYKGAGPVKNLASSHVYVDSDFLSLYKIQLVAGKDFTKEGNGKEYIVNESLAKELLKETPKASFESLIGQRFWTNEDSMSTIVGVAKDFNFNSLHNKIETLALINQKDGGFHDISVKIDGARAKEAIDFISATYKSICVSAPYEYQFLDEHFENLYKSDAKVSKVVSLLAVIAIIIACLGLLGLASYSAETRVKEIGIRKVLGASVSNIVSLLSKDFLKLVLIANIIAWPLAWFLLGRWLENYAFRIDISIWVFAIAGFVSLLIALLAVSSQTFKAAVTNPVKNLRTE
jgi:putative ABC transport system permease protein